MSTREAFRQSFHKVNRDVLRWFPGHMTKGMREMNQQLKNVDLVIEVHDARIPFSGRNPNFRSFTGVKPHVLVLNKIDLSDKRYIPQVEKRMKSLGVSNVLFTNCKDEKCPGVGMLIPAMKKIAQESIRYNRLYTADITVLIFGVPNVGKSSLMNLLRVRGAHKGGSAPVGAVAGITRAVQNRVKVCTNPNIYVLDTPGILQPTLPNEEAALRLATCSTLQDHLVGEQLIADYILFWMNKNYNFRYVEAMKLDKPYDRIDLMLANVAINFNLLHKARNAEGLMVQMPSLEMAAKMFIKAFRTKQFGPILLDTDYL